MYSFAQKESLSRVCDVPGNIGGYWGYKDDPHTPCPWGALRGPVPGQCSTGLSVRFPVHDVNGLQRVSEGAEIFLVELFVSVCLSKRDTILAINPINSVRGGECGSERSY